MKAFETTTTVEGEGSVRLTGVPFEPGTRVDVTITVAADAKSQDVEPSERAARLLRALDAARNDKPIGRFTRSDLYDRDVLR
jgi:hypothetical protein